MLCDELSQQHAPILPLNRAVAEACRAARAYAIKDSGFDLIQNGMADLS
jgi:hypothetical protein